MKLMTTGDAIKLLTQNGFQEVNQKGSHKKFAKGDLRFTLIYHSSPKETLTRIAVKTLNKILEQSKQ